MFDENRITGRKLVTFGADATHNATILRGFTVNVETGLRSKTGGVVLHCGPIYLNASTVNSHAIQRAPLDISTDDLLFDRILGVKTSGVAAGIISADLPPCPCEAVEVAVVATNVITLGAAAAFRDQHTN